MSHSFLYSLVLPFIECYMMTIVFFASNMIEVYEEETLYSKIQWIIETFYEKGILKFNESCILESITNAVSKFIEIGVLKLQKIQIKRNFEKTFIQVSEKFKADDMNDIYDSLAYYLPYAQTIELSTMQKEVRLLTISEI